MGTSYTTTVIGEGNHASLEIPDHVLEELGANKRAPLFITVNEYTYRSTATAVGGRCRVVFPQRDRAAAGAAAGDTVTVHLELDAGHREVDIPAQLEVALTSVGLRERFDALVYSQRKEFARQISDAKAEDTRTRRIAKVIAALSEKN